MISTRQLYLTAIVVWACFIASFLSEEEASARLLLYKTSYTNPVVEGENFVITYQLINNGDAIATKIDIMDRYDPNSFDMIENANEDGSVTFVFEEIQPGGQMTFNVTVRPKLYGIYESTRARIKYNSGMPSYDSEEEDIRRGSSSSLGRIRIISAADHFRNTSYYIKEWVIFSSCFAMAILVPFYNWWNLRKKKFVKSE